jgi:peptidoglycan/LPS O-acetylase OafA/YrhL
VRREISTFLDLLRLTADHVVFLGHLSSPRFGGEALELFGRLNHSAVVVFFVLSGYVIAWAAQRDGNSVDYIINRAARIYSVALPALALTFALDFATGNTGYQHAEPWKYLPLFLTFTTDWWFLNEDAFSNIPYWSLSYEVWYYVAFGIYFFGRGPWRFALSGAILALAGPRLWLLFPIWMLGAALHAIPAARRPRLLLAAAILGAIALKSSGLDDAVNDAFDAALGGFAKAHLRYSQYVVGDYLFAGLVALAILAARDADLRTLGRYHGAIAATASVTFSLYLTHFPLLLAFSKAFPDDPLAIGVTTLACAVAFGMVFERNKAVARRIAAMALSPFRTALPTAAPAPAPAGRPPTRR